MQFFIMAVAVTRIMFHRGTEETSPILREIILQTSDYGGPYMQDVAKRRLPAKFAG